VLLALRHWARRPPTPTLVPYTTLFRSARAVHGAHRLEVEARVAGAAHELDVGNRPVAPDVETDRRLPAAPALPPEAPVDLVDDRSEEHTSELQSRENLVCRLLLEKKKK